jgi:hypothetical protein
MQDFLPQPLFLGLFGDAPYTEIRTRHVDGVMDDVMERTCDRF